MLVHFLGRLTAYYAISYVPNTQNYKKTGWNLRSHITALITCLQSNESVLINASLMIHRVPSQINTSLIVFLDTRSVYCFISDLLMLIAMLIVFVGAMVHCWELIMKTDSQQIKIKNIQKIRNDNTCLQRNEFSALKATFSD